VPVTGGGGVAGDTASSGASPGAGAVCQPKTALDPALPFTSGHDLVGRPDGSSVWASDASGALAIVTLTPG